MSQNIFLDPIVSSLPSLTPGSVGNGVLTVDKLTHFTITQGYTAVCTSVDPFTVFNIIGSLDGPVGVAIVGQQFIDQDSKIFLTINQGPILFEVGDTFEWSVEQGTDLTQSNLDTYDELPQKNFGVGVIGENKGDHNLRFSEAAQLAFRDIQDLKYESKIAGALGNTISLEYIAGSFLNTASKVIQDLTYTAALPGEAGNDIQIAYEQFDPAIAAQALIQDIQFSARIPGAAGDLISITYIGGGTAGSEGVGVVGNAITVTIEDGVSTADQIRTAIGSNPTAFALVDGFSTGTGLEPQNLQPQAFLAGGSDAIGDAGNEVVTVLSTLITIKFEDGVSTAQNLIDAIAGSPAALVLIVPSISGTPATTQTAPLVATNLENGADNLGIPGSEIVEVVGNEIKVTCVDGASTADQLKTALEGNVDANALLTITLLGVGTELQSSPVSRIFLAGGLGQGTFALNTKEFTDAGAFNEGNAALLLTDINNQGDETTSGETLKKGKVTLDDDELANIPGPTVEHAQKTINALIQNGKVILLSENDEKIEWSKPAGTLNTADDIHFIFTETNIKNTIEASNFPLAIADGEHVWVRVDRNNNATLIPNVSTTVPESLQGEDVFRLASRYGDSLIWWDNTLQRAGKKIRIGEGAGTGAYQEKLGVANGVQTVFPILSGLFPVNKESILVFSHMVQFVDTDWDYNVTGNHIEFTVAPELGTEIYIYYLTDGDAITPPTPTGVLHSYVHTVSVLEAINKEIQLIAIPLQPTKILVDIIGGGPQEFGVDFTIGLDLFQWTAFALDGDLTTGDKIRFRFYS